ncbi:unnamed protein product, partial [Choristocarpus tenellus]
SSWITIVDEGTNEQYYYNSVTAETSWELGEEERIASGIGDNNSNEEKGQQGSVSISEEIGQQSNIDWQHEVLSEFHVPEEVSELAGRSGSAQILPRTTTGELSKLIHWYFTGVQAGDPYREHFVTGNNWNHEHKEFEPKLSFFAFESAVEHAEHYWVEEAEAPFRARLRRPKSKFSRDITKWEKRTADRKRGHFSFFKPIAPLWVKVSWGGGGGGGGWGGRGGGGGGEGGGGGWWS